MRLMMGDCLERMAEIEDGSVDLVLTDPPYGTTACKWDAVIPFGPMWDHVWRVLKPNGAAVFTASQPFTSSLVMSEIKTFKYCLVWDKVLPTGFAVAKIRPMKQHEDICVFARGKSTYNPQLTLRDKARKYNRTHVRYEGSENLQSHDGNDRTLTHRQPRSIIVASNADQKSKKHPTQKPVALMEYLIKTYTNKGETILDFTMGSGTTGVACANTNRHFIGIERDPTYFQIAQDRIEEARRRLI